MHVLIFGKLGVGWNRCCDWCLMEKILSKGEIGWIGVGVGW